jgi:hypothetical protein
VIIESSIRIPPPNETTMIPSNLAVSRRLAVLRSASRQCGARNFSSTSKAPRIFAGANFADIGLQPEKKGLHDPLSTPVALSNLPNGHHNGGNGSGSSGSGNSANNTNTPTAGGPWPVWAAHSTRHIIGVGKNYPEHVLEMAKMVPEVDGKNGPGKAKPPAEPILFLKPVSSMLFYDEAESAGSGSGSGSRGGGNITKSSNNVIRFPKSIGTVNHEVEVAVIIGKTARGVSEVEAMEFVEGITVRGI